MQLILLVYAMLYGIFFIRLFNIWSYYFDSDKNIWILYIVYNKCKFVFLYNIFIELVDKNNIYI